MPHDIYSIDPAGAVGAGDELLRTVRPLRDASTDVGALDREGADLAPATTVLVQLLDEIAAEMTMLGDVFLLRGELSALADRHVTEPGAFDALYERFDVSIGDLRESVDDEVGAEAVVFAPTDDWSVADVTEWWGTLSDAERWQLVFDESELVGNTDGITVDHRFVANRVTIQTLVDGGSDDERLDQFVDPITGQADRDRQILVFDPSGDGLVAEVFGDLAAASSIGIVVPGMGSQMSNFTNVRHDAAVLHGGAPDVATVAWSGYDAPEGLSSDVAKSLTGLWEVAGDGLATTGGTRLVRFTDGIRIAATTSSTVTVIGHSYGSLTAGHAVQQGLDADRVVFIGSPGVGVDHVGEFVNVHIGAYFAGDVHGDPVADLKRFGDAPTDPDFGATVFDAGDPDGIGLSRHSEYFDDGAAIDNLRTIVSGGEPTEANVPWVDRITEPYSDLDIPFTPIDDVPTGWIDNVGAHGQDAVEAGVDWTGAKVGDAVDGFHDTASDVRDGLGQLRDRLVPDPSSFLD